MIDRRDIWRSARLLIKHHGEGAADEALSQADKLALAADTEGCAVMREVATAVRELERREPNEGESIS